MNDENENNELGEVAADVITELQNEVDSLSAALEAGAGRIRELEAAPKETAAPAGDAELRALAVTVRTAQRSGHPDATKHLDILLKALGAP